MTFIKMLIGLPVVIVILIFAFVNNDLVEFNFWPFYIEITVSQSVAIVILVLLGFLLGKLDSWLSYSPLRAALRREKKENKKLNKAHLKLTEQVSDLQDNIVNLQEEKKAVEASLPKPSFSEKVKNLFRKDKSEA